MTLVTSMPAVRESSGENPQKLERVEIRPGVFLKLNAADKKLLFAERERAAKAEAAWRKVVVGETVDAEPEPEAEPVAEPAPEPEAEPEPKAEAKPTRSRKTR